MKALSADLEIQIDLVGRILKKDRDEVITEAVRLFCRSIAGGAPRSLRRPRKGDASSAAARAAESPGSLEGRIVAFVTKHGEVKPGAVAAAMKVDVHRARRVVQALVATGCLRASGSTMSRRIALA